MEVFTDQLLQSRNPRRMRIEGRNELEVLASGFLKRFQRLLSNLFERLQSVCHKRWTEDGEPFLSCLPQLFNHMIRVRLEPRISSQPRLKGHRPASCR